MDELLEILEDIKPNVDFKTCTDLIDGGYLDCGQGRPDFSHQAKHGKKLCPRKMGEYFRPCTSRRRLCACHSAGTLGGDRD